MFNGCRWLNDKRFATPMINNQWAGHIFVGDFINYNADGLKLAKVKLFYQKVWDMHCM